MRTIDSTPTAFKLDEAMRRLHQAQMESSSSEFDYGIAKAIEILNSCIVADEVDKAIAEAPVEASVEDNDFISRKALLDRLDGFSFKIGGSANAMALTIMDETKKAVREIIKDQPAASPLKGMIDAEKQLPCKVGDTVWELCKCHDGIYRIFPMKVTKIVPYGSVRWTKGKIPAAVWNIYAISDCTDMYKSFYDLGHTVFLTESEAKAALKEMEAVR